MIFAKPPAPRTPADLLAEVRTAQETHAQAIATANQTLLDAHGAVYDHVDDRRTVIGEQVRLLQAEDAGLRQVQAAVQDAHSPF